MWAGFPIQGSIKDVKGLERSRNTLFLFLVFRDLVRFPPSQEEGMRVWDITNIICPYSFYVNPGFVNRCSYTSDLQEAALLLDCKGAELLKAVYWLCHCFLSVFYIFSDSYANMYFNQNSVCNFLC